MYRTIIRRTFIVDAGALRLRLEREGLDTIVWVGVEGGREKERRFQGYKEAPGFRPGPRVKGGWKRAKRGSALRWKSAARYISRVIDKRGPARACRRKPATLLAC